MQLVFATNNPGKLKEVASLLNRSIELLSLEQINCRKEIPETGQTLEENAFQKAAFVLENYGYDCFADDTGLEVAALNNEPGVYSARYAGPENDSEANMTKLLEEMKVKKNRKALFRTVISLLINGGSYFFEGIVNGEISEEKKGTGGFGYDPVFVPDGSDKTFAEMSLEEKNGLSHRAIALKKMIAFLNSYSQLNC